MIMHVWATRSNAILPSKRQIIKKHCGKLCLMTIGCDCHRSCTAYWEKKMEPYEKAHAGLPLVQHSLLLMLHYYKQGKITLEKIAEKMSHAVADCFQISDRGYIREGYYADLVIVDMNQIHHCFPKENILYKCGWSPWRIWNFLHPSLIHL